jgi:hypothetical protein
MVQPIYSDGPEPRISRDTASVPYWFGHTAVWPTKNGIVLTLCGIVLFGAGLRVYVLDYQSFWSDEVFSLVVTDPTLTFREFWDRVLTDTRLDGTTRIILQCVNFGSSP